MSSGYVTSSLTAGSGLRGKLAMISAGDGTLDDDMVVAVVFVSADVDS